VKPAASPAPPEAELEAAALVVLVLVVLELLDELSLGVVSWIVLVDGGALVLAVFAGPGPAAVLRLELPPLEPQPVMSAAVVMTAAAR
jgi:hypothetical protein